MQRDKHQGVKTHGKVVAGFFFQGIKTHRKVVAGFFQIINNILGQLQYEWDLSYEKAPH